jgi:hypothetical protein
VRWIFSVPLNNSPWPGLVHRLVASPIGSPAPQFAGSSLGLDFKSRLNGGEPLDGRYPRAKRASGIGTGEEKVDEIDGEGATREAREGVPISQVAKCSVRGERMGG